MIFPVIIFIYFHKNNTFRFIIPKKSYCFFSIFLVFSTIPSLLKAIHSQKSFPLIFCKNNVIKLSHYFFNTSYQLLGNPKRSISIIPSYSSKSASILVKILFHSFSSKIKNFIIYIISKTLLLTI